MTSAIQPVIRLTRCTPPYVQASIGFGKKCVFSTFHQRFIFIHLFYSYLIHLTGLFPLTVQYLIVAHSAPRGGLLAPPEKRQRWVCHHLNYNIEYAIFRCRFIQSTQSSRQGEFHPKPLSEPCLIVSHHTALQLIISKQILLLAQLFTTSYQAATPFAPLPLQELHHYYEVVRHLTSPRYSASRVFAPLVPFPLHPCKTSPVP